MPHSALISPVDLEGPRRFRKDILSGLKDLFRPVLLAARSRPSIADRRLGNALSP